MRWWRARGERRLLLMPCPSYGRPRQQMLCRRLFQWILLASLLLLGVALSALFGILAPGILASERFTLPRAGAFVGAKAAGWDRRAVRPAASAIPPVVTPRCGALPGPMSCVRYPKTSIMVISCHLLTVVMIL